MTDSDSLRGNSRYFAGAPNPAIHELETLRALLRPRMTEEGDPTPTDALRGMFVEIERLRATTSEGDRCRALESSLAGRSQAHETTRQTLQLLRGRLHEALSLSMEGASDKDIFERIESLNGKLAEERKRSKLLAEEWGAEQRLASAAATGHDHARGLLVAIAEVFGRVDDLDSLPAKVRELSDNCLHNCTKAERLQASIAATERRRLEADLVAMTTAIGNAAKDVGVLCEGRAAVDILPDLLGLMKSRVRRAAEMDERRAKWAHEFSAQAQAEAQADSVAFVREHEIKAARWTKICEAFGFDPEQDPPVSIPAILVGNRWTNTRRMLADACAKLQAPSLEIVLGGLVLGLSEAREAARAMGHGQTVCTGCARRIAHGEAKQPVQGCGDCWWLEFGDAPLAGFQWANPEPCSTVLPATAQAPLEAPCPKLEEPCHVRKGPESSLLSIAPQVWIIEPIALPGYVISGRNDSWMWKAEQGASPNITISYAIAGYKTATAAIAGAREHHNRTVAALDAAGLPQPGRARCPVCHRMAPVKDGGFQPHTSGESTCSGSARPASFAWREWIMGKDVGLHYGWPDSELRAKFDEHATEARRLTDERIDALQKHVGDLAEALNEKTAALDAVPAQLAALKDTADAAHAAMRRLGWDGSTYPDEWAIACALSNVHRTAELRALREKVDVLEAQLAAASEDTDEIEAVREAIGVPAGKPLMSYVVHAAAGMQALAILGWQDGHPVEWATKRAAAEADLRGAFAEAELVGSDHAAMVRQLWGNLRKLGVATSRIELAEKRISTWRAWVVGMCPADLAHDNMSDDGLRAFMTYVPASALDNVQAKLRDALDGIDNWRIWAESFGVCPVGSSVADLQGAIRASWNRLKARNEKLIGLVGVLRSIKQLVAVDLSA